MSHNIHHKFGDILESGNLQRGVYVFFINGSEPEYFDEACQCDHKSEWVKAMQEKMNSLHENHTHDLVKLSNSNEAVQNKWVFRLKHEENNSHPRYKTRLVVKRFGQRKDIDFNEMVKLA